MALAINISICLLFSMYIYTFFIAKRLDAQKREYDDIIDADMFE